MNAWHHWYHVTLTGYGQWLPGDPRGWRAKDHANHVQGDYKNPPAPSTFQKNLHAHAKELLKNDPVSFPDDLREPIGERIVASLRIQKIAFKCAAVGSTHIHFIVQCPKDDPKMVGGKCKQNVTRNVPCHEKSGWWAADCSAKPIRDAAHFANAVQYVMDHIDEGAWVLKVHERADA